jgi:hypothetical protein
MKVINRSLLKDNPDPYQANHAFELRLWRELLLLGHGDPVALIPPAATVTLQPDCLLLHI